MQSPTNAIPVVYGKSLGMDDQDSVVKVPKGYVPFMLNLDTSSEAWARRPGRTWVELLSGYSLGIFNLPWEDGSITQVGQFGANFYNISVNFDYLFGSGIRLLLQSPDLNWWNVTPDATTGIISPTVVTYTGTALTSNLSITRYQLFGFTGTSGIWRFWMNNTPAIVTDLYTTATGTTTYTADRAFATGYGPVIEDCTNQDWKCMVGNDGAITLTLT